MGAVWEADRAVDVGLAAALVAEQFPELAHLPVRRFATGWDNAVFLVGDDVVFRFVHREVAVPLAEREVAVLRRVAGRLPLRVPEPRWVGRPTASFDRPFWGGPLVPGVELAEADLDEQDRVPVATALGGFLRALHDPALAADVVAGVAEDDVVLPVDPMRRADPAVSAERARPVLDRLAATGAHVPVAALHTLLDEAVEAGPAGGEPVLTHGDLHLRHLLVAGGEAAGVIDWGDTCLGRPSTDLALAYAAFVGSARRAFLDAYGDVEDATALRARATAVRIVSALLEQVLADGDAALAVEARTALHRVLAP